MALPDTFSPQRLFIGVNFQNDFRDLSPIGSFALGVEQAQISHEVLLIVPCQDGFGRSQIGYGRVERWLLHIARPETIALSLSATLATMTCGRCWCQRGGSGHAAGSHWQWVSSQKQSQQVSRTLAPSSR
jgi:hypothetical protein